MPVGSGGGLVGAVHRRYQALDQLKALAEDRVYDTKAPSPKSKLPYLLLQELGGPSRPTSDRVDIGEKSFQTTYVAEGRDDCRHYGNLIALWLKSQPVYTGLEDQYVWFILDNDVLRDTGEKSENNNEVWAYTCRFRVTVPEPFPEVTWVPAPPNR